MLIEAALHFPTVIFTIGLGIALIYWVFVLLGALDIDLLGGDADVDVGDAGGDVGDAGDAGDADVAKGGISTGGVWSGLGLTRVPLTISISMILLVCWVLSLLGSHYLPLALGSATWVTWLLLPASLVVGLPISAVLVRPLGRVFTMSEGKSNRDYVGHTCTITTGHVDENFGQATVEDGGTVLVIPVRCDKAGLVRHDKALIIDFDTDRQAYVVEPAKDMLPVREGSGEA